MDLSELKLVSASNIIKYRTAKGMTQAELGAALNYSDKSVSKWERGESIPDAFVLKQMAELFGVTVDALLTSDDKWQPPKSDEVEEVTYRVGVIIAIAIVGVFTVALAVFIALWFITGKPVWKVFLPGASVAALVHMVLYIVFRRGRGMQFILALFIASLFVNAFFFLPLKTPWQVFLLLVPAEMLVFLGCNVRRRKKRCNSNKKSATLQKVE